MKTCVTASGTSSTPPPPPSCAPIFLIRLPEESVKKMTPLGSKSAPRGWFIMTATPVPSAKPVPPPPARVDTRP